MELANTQKESLAWLDQVGEELESDESLDQAKNVHEVEKMKEENEKLAKKNSEVVA